MTERWHERIIIDPEKYHGKPCIKCDASGFAVRRAETSLGFPAKGPRNFRYGRAGVARSPLTRPAPAEQRRQRATLPRERAQQPKFESLQKFHSFRALSAKQAAKPLIGRNLETPWRGFEPAEKARLPVVANAARIRSCSGAQAQKSNRGLAPASSARITRAMIRALYICDTPHVVDAVDSSKRRDNAVQMLKVYG
jgi:hypothetical protein